MDLTTQDESYHPNMIGLQNSLITY